MTINRRSRMRSSLFLFVALSAATLAACHDDEVCNPGAGLKDGVCVPLDRLGDGAATDATSGKAGDGGTAGADAAAGHDGAAGAASDASDATSADAADSGGDAASDGPTDGAASNFGATCADSNDCAGGPANYCAKQPGAATGICSHTGCDTTPSVCPATWSCYIVPSVIAVCTPTQA
jgi:hypothetical protein